MRLELILNACNAVVLPNLTITPPTNYLLIIKNINYYPLYNYNIII